MTECVFKNFKKCYVQKDEIKQPAEYKYLICIACLLSRVEKQLFRVNKDKLNNTHDSSHR